MFLRFIYYAHCFKITQIAVIVYLMEIESERQISPHRKADKIRLSKL